MVVRISFGDGPVDRGPAGIAVNLATREKLFHEVASLWQKGRGFTLATVNLDHMVKMQHDPDFLKAYQSHTYVVADGNPIVWLSRVAGTPVDLVPGSELLIPLAKQAVAAKIPVALFGSSQKTLDKAAEEMREMIDGLQIVACLSPSLNFDPAGAEADRYLEKLAKSEARLCFLALGAPKQEIFAVRARQVMPACGFVSIGAGLDFIAKSQVRAPKWMRAMAMEWAWRLMQNPRRLAKRYLLSALILPRLFFVVWASKQKRIRRENDG